MGVFLGRFLGGTGRKPPTFHADRRLQTVCCSCNEILIFPPLFFFLSLAPLFFFFFLSHPPPPLVCVRAGSWSSQAEPAHFLYCIIPQAVCSLCKQAFPPRAVRPGRGCAPGLPAQTPRIPPAPGPAPARTPRAPPRRARPASCSATPGEEPGDPPARPPPLHSAPEPSGPQVGLHPGFVPLLMLPRKGDPWASCSLPIVGIEEEFGDRRGGEWGSGLGCSGHRAAFIADQR